MEQITELKEDLADVRKAELDARALVTKAEADAKTKATEVFAQEKSVLTEELAAKNKQLNTFREQELALRRQKQELEEKQVNFQVEFERKLDDERTRLAKQIGSSEAERFALIEAEYKKKIDDAQKATRTLSVNSTRDRSRSRERCWSFSSSTCFSPPSSTTRSTR